MLFLLSDVHVWDKPWNGVMVYLVMYAVSSVTRAMHNTVTTNAAVSGAILAKDTQVLLLFIHCRG